MRLRIPGPTPCPDEVLEAMASPMVNHRGPEFKEMILRLTQNTQRVLQTTNDVFFLTSSGSGALEATVVNTLSPGDEVLAVISGFFGERFARIAETYGARVERLTFPLGQGVDPKAVQKALREHSEVKAVLVTHNDTSTGVANDLEAIAKVVKGELGKLLLVDAVSSVGCIPLPVDLWQCDVVATASQKGLMAPPGIGIVSVSPQAWEAHRTAQMPRFYFDFTQAKSYLDRGQTPWTPALSVLFSLDVSVQRLLAQGLEATFQRHARLAQMTRDGIKALGLTLFGDERYASDIVTPVNVPPGVDGAKLVEVLRTQYDMVVGGGQQSLQGKIFRIGHMGFCFEEDIRQVLDALQGALPQLGFTLAGAARQSG